MQANIAPVGTKRKRRHDEYSTCSDTTDNESTELPQPVPTPPTHVNSGTQLGTMGPPWRPGVSVEARGTPTSNAAQMRVAAHAAPMWRAEGVSVEAMTASDVAQRRVAAHAARRSLRPRTVPRLTQDCDLFDEDEKSMSG